MSRRILMTGDKARYVENRSADSAADEREIIMCGDNATYEENSGVAEIVENEAAVELAQQPSPLYSSEALRLWEIAVKKGWVDSDFKPKLSENRAAILADVMADCLRLSPRWKPFEELWGIQNLCNKHSKSLNQKYYTDLQQEYKDAFR